MNRLNVRLLGAFTIVLVLTLVIMWFALLLVLRSQPPNTDTAALSLATVVIDASQLTVERITAAREQARQDDTDSTLTQRTVNRITENVLRQTLTEQAVNTNSRMMIVRGSNCVLWDSDSADENSIYLLETSMSGELLLGTRRRLSSNIVTGQLVANDDSQWLYAALPITSIENLIPSVTLAFLRNINDVCSSLEEDEQPIFYIVAAEPYPEQSIRSVLDTYRDEGLFLALIQAVIIGIFFALIASYTIVRWVSHPLNDLANSAVGIAQGDYGRRAIIRGPNEVQVVATSFNQMAAQVQASRQAQQDFFANVSHDLRTPLTSIQGFAQAIAEGVTDGDAAKRSATVIQSEAGRMSRMVNDLLELAKIQAGRVEMTKRVIDVGPIVALVGESLNIKAQQKGVILQTQLEPLPRVAGDGDRLAQVFTNLLDNAIKHTDAGGTVWLRAKPDQDGVLIQVEDTGEGIPPEDLPRIFERFYQVDKSRAKLQGTGLGLAISKEIITAHQGKMWVESEYAQGTRFSVWLPMLDHDSTTIVSRRF